MLEIRELSKTYGRKRVLDKVSFAIEPGTVLGYLGPNGAGKSTTMKMLAGILEPTTGSILYQGNGIQKGSQLVNYKQRLGYIPEQSVVYRHLSAVEYLELVGGLRGIQDDVLNRRIEGFMERFNLEAAAHSPMSSYSRGMIQKVVIAASLIHDPDIWILDEPMSGLDISSTMMMRELIALLAQQGKIIICSSHILEIIEKICHRVIIINKGKIVAHDEVARLRELQNSPSLESIFQQLVANDNPEESARQIHHLISTR